MSINLETFTAPSKAASRFRLAISLTGLIIGCIVMLNAVLSLNAGYILMSSVGLMVCSFAVGLNVATLK